MGASVEHDDEGTKKPSKPRALFEKTIFKVTKQMAYRPILWCSCCCSFILLVVIVALITGYAAYSRNSDYDWVIASTTESKNNDALLDAIDNVDQVQSTGTRQEVYEQGFFFLFEMKKDTDLYEPENVQHMCNVESALVLNEDYPKFCRLTDTGECELPPTSISVYFYDFTTIDSWNCTLLNQSVVDAKKNSIYGSMDTPQGQEENGLWLGDNAPDKGYTTRCNSMWSFGAPLDGYNTTSDNEVEQGEEYSKFLSAIDGSIGGVEETLFEYFSMKTNEDAFLKYYPSAYMDDASEPGIDVLFYSGLMTNNETTRMLATDLLFAIFSILFVLFWLRVHTNSTFIALLGMFMIFSSLPFSLALYSGLYQIPFFSQLHSLVLFIVLGVGADDVFVLVDSWRMTEHIFPGDISNGANKKLVHQRLLHCYKHTMDTVFNTSFTTAMAFIATGFNPLMPIATFGWYAATCIVVNYMFVITLMPTVVVIADTYFRNWIPCTNAAPLDNEGFEKQPDHGSVDENSHADGRERRSTAGDADDRKASDMVEENKVEQSLTTGQGALLGDDIGGVEGIEMIQKDKETDDDEGLEEAMALSETPEFHSKEMEFKPNALVEGYIKFMSYSVYVDEKKERPIPIVAVSIVLGLLAFGIVGVYYGLLLVPPTQQESWFPEQHMFTLSSDALVNDFLSSSDNAYAPLRLTFGISGIDRSDYNIYIPDKNRGEVKFNNGWNLAQPSCQKAMIRMCADVQEYKCDSSGCGSSKLLARYNTTECFMGDFRLWMDSNYGVDTYDMNENDFYGNLTVFRETQYQRYDEYSTWQDKIGFIDGELKFGTVTLTTTMESFSEMVIKEEVLDVIHRFVKKVKNYEECNTCDCSSLRPSSDFAFTWLRTEQGLVAGFYQGILIAFPVAFCVLLFATGNIIISIYAIVSVFFIVFGVLGFAKYALDWNLGIAESIAGIIIIGFAVDYTVHLGHMYTTGEHVGLTDRRAQFEFASRKIALTIVGGAITTVGAGAPMFACQLVFFQKMAALIVCTILMSYVYSLGFFMAVLYTIGPERDQGKISAIYASVKRMLNLGNTGDAGDKKEEVIPVEEQ